eukprot:scaffold1757_cov266-Pinguiococcus_pyrenoidosus.AAC.9
MMDFEWTLSTNRPLSSAAQPVEPPRLLWEAAERSAGLHSWPLPQVLLHRPTESYASLPHPASFCPAYCQLRGQSAFAPWFPARWQHSGSPRHPLSPAQAADMRAEGEPPGR